MIIALVGISTLISLVRGFTREAMSLVVWVAAFACYSFPTLSVHFSSGIDTPSLRIAAVYLVVCCHLDCRRHCQLSDCLVGQIDWPRGPIGCWDFLWCDARGVWLQQRFGDELDAFGKRYLVAELGVDSSF